MCGQHEKTLCRNKGFLVFGGGGGNRTPVRKLSTKRSTYLVLPIWESRFHHADRQAFRKPVTLNLTVCQVTRQTASQCNMTLP